MKRARSEKKEGGKKKPAPALEVQKKEKTKSASKLMEEAMMMMEKAREMKLMKQKSKVSKERKSKRQKKEKAVEVEKSAEPGVKPEEVAVRQGGRPRAAAFSDLAQPDYSVEGIEKKQQDPIRKEPILAYDETKQRVVAVTQNVADPSKYLVEEASADPNLINFLHSIGRNQNSRNPVASMEPYAPDKKIQLGIASLVG